MLIKHARCAVVNVKDFGSPQGSTAQWTDSRTVVQARPYLSSFLQTEPDFTVRFEGGLRCNALWTLTLTMQLPFTENAPPFSTIKNIIFLPANFLC